MKSKSKHTLIISYPEYNIWVTLLTSVDPNLKEFRFTWSDGVIRYLTLDEIINSPFSYLKDSLSKLTEAVDEDKIAFYNNELYTKF